jgi:PhnB protein
MQLNTYLVFNGRCEEAFRFYERTLNGRIESMLSHAGTPAEQHVPSEWKNKIMHASMTVNNAVLMGSDAPPDRYQPPKGFSVSLQIKDPAEAERLFQALAEKGRVSMPLQETFWAVRFGMVVDQFGIPWMINCGKSA